MSILMNLRKSALVHPALTPMWICTLPSAPSNHKTSWPQGLFYPPLMFPRHDWHMFVSTCTSPALFRNEFRVTCPNPAFHRVLTIICSQPPCPAPRSQRRLTEKQTGRYDLAAHQTDRSIHVDFYTPDTPFSRQSAHAMFFSPSANYEEGYGDRISNNR